MGPFNTAYGADLVGATIVRVRGIVRTASTNVGQGAILAAAVMAQTNRTVDSATEGPINQPYADWFVYEPFVTDGASTSNTEVCARKVDIKAMRKLEELGDAAYLFYAFGLGNSVSATIQWHLSIGLKLP